MTKMGQVSERSGQDSSCKKVGQAGLRNIKAGNSNRNGESDSSKYKGESSKTLEGTDVKKNTGRPV